MTDVSERAEPYAAISETQDGWCWTVRCGRTGAVLAEGSADKAAIAHVQSASAIAAIRARAGRGPP